MMPIDSYEKFCKAFAGDSAERRQAETLLFLQDWAVTVAEWINGESVDYSLDRLLEQNGSRSFSVFTRKDVVSRLIDDTQGAIRRISENMRDTIIRENVRQPVYKVREINSYGLNWLSRRPGRTVKEKIANSNSTMMAVQRRRSLDTGENRLLMAFLREMAEVLDKKTTMMPENRIRREELDFASSIFLMLKNQDLSEIRRWENLPPNNTLLSDQNYKKIWRSWNELKKIDNIISDDFTMLDERLATLLFVSFLTAAKKYIAIPQVPIIMDYATRSLQLCAPYFCGIDASGELVRIALSGNKITVKYRKSDYEIAVIDRNLLLREPNADERRLPVEAGGITRYADLVLSKLDCPRKLPHLPGHPSSPQYYDRLTMDLFHVRPRYAADGSPVQELDGRILFQKHAFITDGEETPHNYAVPCDQAQAIEMASGIETYSVLSSVEDSQSAHLAELAHLLETYIRVRHFTFLFPDAYNEFQLSMVHKAARLAFPDVKAFPRSMGVAFSYMQRRDFNDIFDKGDFLLILDLTNDDLSFTLVQSVYDEKIAKDIPEYNGLIWERHPTVLKSMSNEIDRMTDKLLGQGCLEKEQVYKLFGLSGLVSESGKLSILFDQNHAFQFTDGTSLTEDRIPVTDHVQRFLNQHKQIIGGARIHIVSLSSALFYKGFESFRVISCDDAIQGYQFFAKLQARTEHMLWKDHLPELAIKLLYGKFNLIEDQTVQPAFNLEKKIPITRRFTLNCGKPEYRFVLVRNDMNRKTRYAAVVRNPAFPLAEDVECRLDMTYQYGAEDPYRLLFIPTNPKAGFAEAKVSWEPIGEYPYRDQPYPEALQPLSWCDMQSFDGRHGVEDLLYGPNGVVNYFRGILADYKTINLDDYNYSIKGVSPKRRIILIMNDNGEKCRITIAEDFLERAKGTSNIAFDQLHEISFSVEEDFSNKKATRYVADLKVGAHYGEIWQNKGKGHFCIRDLYLDGGYKTVAFFENMFSPQDCFSTHITNVSFELDASQGQFQGRYRATKIHDEDDGPYQPERSYWAKHIRRGNCPPNYFYGGRAYFLFHTVFGGGNSIYKSGTPDELRKAFEDAKSEWLRIYHLCNDDQAKGIMFSLMSMCAVDIGDPYYQIANARLDELMARPDLPLPDYMGYALGDCTTPQQLTLLERFTLLENDNPLRVIRLLSKAAWGDPNFIINADKRLLIHYYDIAVDSLKWMCKEKKFGIKNRKKITACLEYILAMFRLRSLNDEGLNRYLSRNETATQDLYQSLEVLVETITAGNIEIRSFLKLDIPNKGIYKDIPDLLYALLVYVAGETEASDIRIAGLSLDDIEA